MKKDHKLSGRPTIHRSELPSDATEKDVRIYRALYTSLSTPPPSGLPADFAQRVAMRAMPQKAPEVRPEYFASTALWITLALLFSVAATYYVQAELFEQLVQQVIRTKEIMLFGVLILALIQLSDHWLVRTKRALY